MTSRTPPPRATRIVGAWLFTLGWIGACSATPHVVEVGEGEPPAVSSASASTAPAPSVEAIAADAGASDASVEDGGAPDANAPRRTWKQPKLDADRPVLVVGMDVAISVSEQRWVEIYDAHAEPASIRAQPFHGTITPAQLAAFAQAIAKADVCGPVRWNGGAIEIAIRSTLPEICSTDVSDLRNSPEHHRRFVAVLKAMRQLQRDVCQGKCPPHLSPW